MSRAEKRHMDRMEAWFNSLSEDKKQKIYEIINEKINSNNNMMTAISDICTVGALDDVLDIDICKIREVVSKTKEYLVEYGEYLEKNGDGGIKMIENEELRNEIKGKIRKYMKGKMDKARGLNLLKHEFNLPYAELSDLWLECKSDKSGNEGYIKSKNLPDTKIEYIEPDPDNVVNSINNIKESNIESTNTLLNADRVVLSPSSNLRIVSVTTHVEGLYGAYTRDIQGVSVGDKHYASKDIVCSEKVDVMNNYNTKMDNIREKITALNAELKEIQDLGMKEIERFTEIESVFDL